MNSRNVDKLDSEDDHSIWYPW